MTQKPDDRFNKTTISVIIPTLNEADNINVCINAARRKYHKSQVEIIVVDGGSTDETLSKLPNDVRLIQTLASRAVQMNTGANASQGEILLFCHADSQLPEGWREVVIEALNKPHVSGGAFQPKFEPAIGFLKWRNRLVFPAKWWLIFGDQCQFLRRSTFDALGGFAEIPILEDLELARSLGERGKLIRVEKHVITSSRRLIENGVLFMTVSNIIKVIGYIHFGVSAEKIARAYRSSREENHERSSDPSSQKPF